MRQRDAMSLPEMLENPNRSSSSLFSLPSIPYFFTITPYPLRAALALPSCQSTQHCVSMKRRLHAETFQKDDAALKNLSLLPDVNEPSAQVYQDASADVWPNSVNIQEAYEGGADSIEGRVLRKMKRIKLDSESPPAEAYDSLSISTNQLDATSIALYGTPYNVPERSLHEQHPHATRADQPRMLGPIRISTKSSESRDAIHATRYGIPAETLSETVISSDRSQDVQAWRQQQQRQQQQEQQQQRQQQQQQQQQDQHGFQHIPFTASTAWHQAQRSSASNSQVLVDDEDNDMEGIDEGHDGRALFCGPHQDQQLTEPQQFLRDERTPHARQQVYGGEVTSRGLGPNVYEDINAQLRAAFLARAELEKGH
ncbi:unnamed protein product [Mortierella alpina]